MTPMALTATAIVGWYLSSALLLSMLALSFAALSRTRWAGRAPERWLAWGWALLGLALALPGIWKGLGVGATAGAPVEIWSGPRLDSGASPPARVTLRWSASPTARGEAGLPLAGLGWGSALLGAGALLSLSRLIVRRRRLGRRCAEMPVLKRLGRLRLSVSDDAVVPFAVRGGGVAYIVVPTGLLTDSSRLRMVVAHEAHHHRRGDLRTGALLGVLRALFFWNPLLALWERAVAEFQDHACDRRVVRRRRVSVLEYGRVLLWAAELAHGPRYPGSGAHGMADAPGGSLKRRILMLSEKRLDGDRRRSWLLGAAACALIGGTSWLVQGAVLDHRLTRAQVESLAAHVEQRAGFRVLVDDQVVAKLDEWVANPEARGRMKAALERMPSYRPMIEKTLRARALPAGLLGMALAESGFDNEAHPDRPVEQRAAGIWQITPNTARRLGLDVSSDLDERLDPRKATEAAATLVADLFARYGDWPVAIAAYNAGANRVDALSAGAASRDELRARVLAGDYEHARYVRAVMAAVILIENPSLLE